MSFVSDLMRKPSALMLSLALISSACVIGCGAPESGGGGGSDEASSAAPEGGSGDAGSGTDDGSGADDGSGSE